MLADEGFFENPADLEAVKNIYKIYFQQIAEKSRQIDKSYRLISPTLDIINNDVELVKFIKENFGHTYHQQGSLRMAPLNKGGIVEPRAGSWSNKPYRR